MNEDSQRTNLIPSLFKNGSIRSSMLVNCEKMIVFSPSPRSSVSCRSFTIIRVLLECGGKSEFGSAAAFFALR